MCYEPPASWYEPEVEQSTPADYGWVHEDDVPDIEHCKDMLEGILEALYKTGDVAKLEDHLDELVSQFEMSLPKTEPVLTAQSSVRQNRMLAEWLQLNQSYNENILEQATR